MTVVDWWVCDGWQDDSSGRVSGRDLQLYKYVCVRVGHVAAQTQRVQHAAFKPLVGVMARGQELHGLPYRAKPLPAK